MGDQDPSFIANLMNQRGDFSLYFKVGDPAKCEVERIGVVASMLMAHSMVCRRALSVEATELEHRWDISIPDINPTTFKHMIKYCYGSFNLKQYSLPELVNLLKVADRYIIIKLLDDLSDAFKQDLLPSNIATALHDPICFQVQPFESIFVEVIRTDTEKVISSPVEHLACICPENMRYIVQMDKLKVTPGDMWRFVLKWARIKVIDEKDFSPDFKFFEELVCPRLIQSCLKFSLLCALNLIKIVEKVCTKSWGQNTHDEVKMMNRFHVVPDIYPKRVIICTETDDQEEHLTHEEFDVKDIYDSSMWTHVIFRSETELYIQTKDSSIELQSVICTGCKKDIGELKFVKDTVMEAGKRKEISPNYNCVCTVKLSIVTSPPSEKVEEEQLITTMEFSETVELDKEFEIPLRNNGERIVLKPLSKYRMQFSFGVPHPFWYAKDDEPSKEEAMFVTCGIVDSINKWRGSNARYILYREV